jgi:hypothetical protein
MARLILGCFLAMAAAAALAAESARERISIDDNWRFTKGDPTNVNSAELLYDVRPIYQGEDQNNVWPKPRRMRRSWRRIGIASSSCGFWRRPILLESLQKS